MIERIEKEYQIACQPCAAEGAIIQGTNYRFTVLTSSLIRMEYSESGCFEDRATQTVINRGFSVPSYHIEETETSLEIITDALRLTYNKKKFTSNGLQIRILGNYSYYSSLWHYGEESNDLKGTARTLDGANGEIPLGHGVISKDGWSILDDSNSLLIAEDGWVESRPNQEVIDIYFWGYGRNYLTCLKDYHHLTGNIPLLPRYALGNWWSRFYRYTENSYKDLMNRFEAEQILFTVAVIDMDWHLTQINPKYGSGWTGYTWNKELFPNPKQFMGWLHQKGMKVTLNVHPADGVRAFEECYPELAKVRGVNTEREDPIVFDIADPQFLGPYFKYIHHPNEEMGVDFWWIDWQQGNNTSIPGLDPLWMLNHYHYLDSQRRGKRGMIFSRYAGPGSHRYPVGFSGDTIITWESLDFQPYFTATASNIGYGWWSHDIGGHMLGVKDDELAVRWLQFGVFSPIMRLHSSNSPFNGKEPWQYSMAAESIMKDFLRLRHRMIPYLYTMNRLCHRDAQSLIQPMYYQHPMDEMAYHVPNQYYFGSELIACPITKPMDKKLGVAKFSGWLPEGNWIDFFTGMIYNGGRNINLYRSLEQIPLLAKAGGIIPMSKKTGNSINNPEKLELRVFAGADGKFHLYEDDGESLEDREENWADTYFYFQWGENSKLEIMPVQGNASVIPKTRAYSIALLGICSDVEITVKVDGTKVTCKTTYDSLTAALWVELDKISVQSDIVIDYAKTRLNDNQPVERVFEFLNKAQISLELKDRIYKAVLMLKNGKNTTFVLGELQTMGLNTELYSVISEFLIAKI